MSPPRPSSGAPDSPSRGPRSTPGAGLDAAEAAVGTALRAEPGLVVLTGGQTGVDTLAARAALTAGLAVHLAFPRGLRQEDGPVTADRLAELRGAALHELQAAGFAARTWTCARLADAVILIDPAGGDGCAETVRAAGQLGRPLLDLTAFSGGPPRGAERRPGVARGPSWPRAAVRSPVTSFLSQNSPRVMLLAGCRGSLLGASGGTAAVAAVLEDVMSALADVARGRPGRPPAGPRA
ncbi:MAG: YpsA SLOG family protein [Streptosporangiaceae bacterium]